MNKITYAILVLFLLVGSLLIYWLGWELTKPLEPNINAGGGSFMNTPKVIEEKLGKDVASLFPAFILWASAVAGIAANILLENSLGNIKKLAKLIILPLILSPAILFGVYSLAASYPDNIAACLLAFQNGFFWQVLTSRFLSPIAGRGSKK
ncbi:MAG TPA: hypothetical protein VGC97_13810 [Pyrinomonadaceae bacterium]|jgi:hypothetical protein